MTESSGERKIEPGTEPHAESSFDPRNEAARELDRLLDEIAPSAAADAGELPDEIDAPGIVPDPDPVPETAASAVPAVNAGRHAPRAPGRLLIMSPVQRSWHDEGIDEPPPSRGAAPVEDDAKPSNTGRRAAVLAAIVAVSAIAGAVGGALATAGFDKPVVRQVAAIAKPDPALQQAMTRMDTEIAALRSSLDHASKQNMAQFAKATDRLDRVEKAQAEPLAKLARMNETLEKLRVAAATPAPTAAAHAAAASPETTGSIPAQPAARSPFKRLPTLSGWVVRDATNGAALVEGRQGVFEVYPGVPLPGAGRVDAIRRQDGRWVVVTSSGLIVSR